MAAPDTPRPKRLLTQLSTDYPNAWKQYDDLLARRAELGGWPAWCWCPLAGAMAIASGGRSDPATLRRAAFDVARVGALAAWRPTQGIYRIDPDLLDAVWTTPVRGDLPVEVLHLLPEWCVYVEVGREVAGRPLHGFFAHLEHDANDGHAELRLLLDFDGALVPLALHLVGTLDAAIDAMLAEVRRNAPGVDSPPDLARAAAETAEPLVSVVLYLCSQAADVRDGKGTGRAPARPERTKVKGGSRTFPPGQATTWEVGYRIGAALRAARAWKGGGGEEQEDRRGPVGHVRRAHWHTYWTGPKDRAQKPVLKWLPPIPVNVDNLDDLIPTVRPVRE